jgi:hypothetical protein
MQVGIEGDRLSLEAVEPDGTVMDRLDLDQARTKAGLILPEK